MRRYRHLTKMDRVRIETLLMKGIGAREIANTIGVHRSTIYRELHRGKFIKKDTELRDIVSYSCDLAELRYRTNLAAKGVGIKIGRDKEFANYIEKKISKENYSPAAVLGEIKAKGLKFKTTICVTTLYSYIDKNVFYSISNHDLPVKSQKRRKYKKIRVREHKRIAGESIENRPDEILDRDEFGHWEMDTVKGKQKQSTSLLVLTERKTRKEIIYKLPNLGAQAVVDKLDQLEREWHDQFSKVFKTITCDNGVEFSFADKLKRSILKQNEARVNLYYCHPYSSYERGSNEVANKMIRRYIPKGTNFDDKSEEEIKAIEKWMNNYPRKIFGYHSSEELFQKELAQLN